MGLVDRAKNICLTPATEWPVIAGEQTTTGTLIGGYAVPLIGVSALAGFIGGSIVGGFFGRTPLVAGLSLAVLVFVFQIIGVFLLSLLINALAPTFGGQKDATQALKVAVYSLTPAWIAGLLQILPLLGILGILGAFYGIYLLYLGLPTLMRAPQDKAVGYTAVVVVCAIAVSMIAGTVVGAIGMAGAIGSGMLSSAADSATTFDKDSPLGKLEELGKAVERSGKEIEAAEARGDAGAAASAALNGLGALLGGGKRFETLGIDEIKGFVPDSFAGLTKRGTGRAQKNGVAGFMVSSAEAEYGDEARRADLSITDTGGASGLLGLASWAAVQSSSEDENGSEKTSKVDGRLVHEKQSKSGDAEYSVVVGERFVVTAKSDDLSVGDLRRAVSALDLAKLEAMKESGASAR